MKLQLLLINQADCSFMFQTDPLTETTSSPAVIQTRVNNTFRALLHISLSYLNFQTETKSLIGKYPAVTVGAIKKLAATLNRERNSLSDQN